MKELLDIYYTAFANKNSDWTSVIADDFKYTGGNIGDTTLVGKDEYIEVISRFSRVFEAMRVESMIIDGDKACVIGNYDFRFPNGVKLNGNVSEIWTARDGKLLSLRIYFDTHTFMVNSK